MDGSSKQSQSSTQTVTRNIAPPTAEEVAAQAQAAAQLQAYQKSLDAFEGSQPYQLSQQVSQSSLQNMLNRQNGTTPLLNAQQQAYLDQAFGPQAQQAQDALRQQAVADAQRRGMTLSDSPTGNEFLRQMANLQGNIASSRAQAGLNLGQQDYQNWLASAPIGLNLQQQAGQNRLALQNQAANFGNMLAQNRIAAAPVTTSGTTTGFSTQPSSATFGQVAGGIGNLMGGTGSLALGLTGKQGLFPALGWGNSTTVPGKPTGAVGTPTGPTVQQPSVSWFD